MQQHDRANEMTFLNTIKETFEKIEYFAAFWSHKRHQNS